MIGKPIKWIDTQAAVFQKDSEHVGAQYDARFVLLMGGDIVRHEFFQFWNVQTRIWIVAFWLALSHQLRSNDVVCVPKIHGGMIND